jgi:transcriptional repressor NrdR
MRCPFCGHEDTQVKDSRPAEDAAAIRRRRFCASCGQRFTTVERVQLRELYVLKTDGRRVPFDREQLEASGETDIPSKQIGEQVMDTLKEVDEVAYVRFASVYRDFREAKDFENFLGSLEEPR